jgi:hypothetical protein
VEHTKLFAFIAILGTAFVTTFLVFLYCDYYLQQNFVLISPPSDYLIGIFGSFLLFGGPILLIVGILGIGRQYFKNHKNLFTVLTVVLVPLFISILIFLMVLFAPLTVGY